MMQHKCTKCGQVYEQGSEEILNGCICGNKLFYFMKKGGRKKKEKPAAELQYFYELEDEENNEIIVFDLEAINIINHGKYEIDINALMNKNGLVYKYGDGKYSIDLDENFKQLKKTKR